MKLQPRRWADFQHYKDRSPPWIKLHRELLNNRDYICLPTASRALAPLLWLLASESKDGTFEASREELMFRLHISSKEYDDGIKPLIDKGFFVVASGVLAECEQSAIPETERETEVETEKEVEAEPPKRRRQQLPEGFTPNEAGISAAQKKGISVPQELEKFRNYHQAKGSVMLDWQAAWRTWVGNCRPTVTKGLDPEWAAFYSRSSSEIVDTTAKVIE